ncbi:hypothetical protein GW17_00062148 [Ensete ventricosum]|nr:hypothetical protein GW17_00062148 [Ensete ventricosum]
MASLVAVAVLPPTPGLRNPHHLFLLLLHHVLTVCSTVAAFAPEDNFLINCGANATVTSADGRPFRPDTSGVLAFLQNFREKEKRIVDDTRSTFNQQSAVLWNEPRASIYND